VALFTFGAACLQIRPIEVEQSKFAAHKNPGAERKQHSGEEK
jgi:hypothetical protein